MLYLQSGSSAVASSVKEQHIFMLLCYCDSFVLIITDQIQIP